MAKGCVLIVDDDLLLRELLCHTLEGRGYVTASAGSAAEAWAYLLEHDMDLVITDVQMPGQNGLTLLRDIKARFPGLPVVIITAYGTMDLVIEALRNGANDFLNKPYKLPVLLDIVAREIAQYRPYSSLRERVLAVPYLKRADIDAIDNLLANIRAGIQARGVLLVDTRGTLIVTKGAVSDCSLEMIRRLVAENVSLGASSTSGGTGSFRLHFHEGDAYSICSGQVTSDISLLVVFGQEVRLGIVLYYVKAAMDELAAILTHTTEPASRGSSSSPSALAETTPPGEPPADDLARGPRALPSFDGLLDNTALDEELLSMLEAQFAELLD